MKEDAKDLGKHLSELEYVILLDHSDFTINIAKDSKIKSKDKILVVEHFMCKFIFKIIKFKI